MAVLVKCFLFTAFNAIQFCAFKQNPSDAEDHRAVRVFRLFALGVMLAVDGCPRLRRHARGAPQPEAEEVADDRMQIQRPMRGMTMQINRYSGDGDVREA